ncbi:putative short-chain dehydrogenase [Apiosordaria backusii]|uniref:Short-chain dehydrogenase n=1 Tax=Apiosordaria backusii TaxID=314023 RepID=A0AA40K6Q1_9PEZI|nr:putative short-chain dehydrogenase [Apiosordaria backusii]
MDAAKGTILVTGSNGGLGSAIAEQIASSPELSAYHGLYTVRDAGAAPALTAALARGAHSHTNDVLSLDLTRLDDVRSVAEMINDRVSSHQIPPIRALILNAGFQDFGKQSWTHDGLDVTFAVNYLGHWLLTLLLLKSMDKESGRIIVIGRALMKLTFNCSPFDHRNNVTGAFKEERYKAFVHDAARFEAIAKGTWSSATEDPSWLSGFRRYGAAKLFLIMMIHELQRRLDRDEALKNICVLGVDPGTMISGLQRHSPWVIRVLLFKIVYPIIVRIFPNGGVRPTSSAASDVLGAAFGSSVGPFPKALYFYRRELLETSAESKDAQKRDLVWTESVKLAHLREDETVLGNYLR